MLIIGQAVVRDILDGDDARVVDLVRQAYLLHEQGRSSVPHSVFLRFPDRPRDRVIGLPAHLDTDPPVAGIKWISSFPGNLAQGLERASAAIVLNSMRTGHPVALVEGSVVSARRTAASAALAADLLTTHRRPDGLALIGCGLINQQVLRFVAGTVAPPPALTLFDTDPARAAAFAEAARALLPEVPTTLARTAEEALAAHRLVAIATTATAPHLDLDACRPGTVLLHLSLRDLRPEAVLAARNVVDDADHVCREHTSLHLAEQLTGGRDFVHATIGGLAGGQVRLPDDDRPVVVSPFGLGVLDLAVAEHVRATADRRGLGVRVDDFLPVPDAIGASAGSPKEWQ
ncbi:2,3-diaminopropionate biosynthesis protein SbnB [Micromonospora sp. DT48]|uniref:2,3-diaminopropionate biosynthesis protein SbnB n=1 Tax=unclassified Micromonospora TaxID=2617518 RepID=UPI0012BC74F4|nr:2,3-diaminopropionate biosynthesis protein SbnB [Micromonospora sp. CP22]MTK04784.1 2,3-diaminopropionate biosynthesis protein SbnB [Micromonospora sp. CP22]